MAAWLRFGPMANESMRDTWATGAEGWVRHERIFDAVFTPFTAALLAAADLGSARRVLDVGCGAGTLLEAAVAAGAEAVGVDISPAMVDAARRRVPAATVVTADAQTADLLAAAPGPSFDRVVSRFGVMFFAEPEAAFLNIRGATAPHARLAFVCWREGESAMFWLGLRALTARLADPPTVPPPGSPGPMGLADADRIREVLTVAGWSDVTIEPIDRLCDYAIDGSDGVEERLAVALSGMIGRTARAELEPRLGPDGWQAAVDEARAELRAELVDGAVRLVGHTWLVTATNR
jgi:SAM-dependent methyltransferase